MMGLVRAASMWAFLTTQVRRSTSSSFWRRCLSYDERNLITSPQSKTIKALAKLLRQRSTSTLVEGPRSILDLLKNPQTSSLVEQIIVDAERYDEYSALLQQASVEDRVPRLLPATRAVLQTCTDTVTTQGIVAQVRIPQSSLEDIRARAQASSAPPLYFIANGVQDPGNLGTLIRSSAAVGVAGIWLLRGCCDPWSPKVVRSSMGTGFMLPILTGCDWHEGRDMLEALECRQILAATMLEGNDSENMSLYDVDFGKATAIVIGSEGQGLGADIRQALVDRTMGAVHVPMQPGVESLNAGVCGSLILFEYYRQQLAKQ